MASHPIFSATFHGDLKKVRELLKADPDVVKLRNAKNLTALHVAASRGHHKVVQLLLEYGADVTGPSENDSWNPLVFASYRGHVEAVEVLIEHGAKVTEKDGNPIHFAGQRKHSEICKILVEHGAIDGLVEAGGKKARELFRAAYRYDHKAVEAILSQDPKLVHCKDKHGRSALHEACTHGDTRTVRVLLRFGAEVELQDDRGQTPLDRASAHSQHSVVKILEQHQASAKYG